MMHSSKFLRTGLRNWQLAILVAGSLLAATAAPSSHAAITKPVGIIIVPGGGGTTPVATGGSIFNVFDGGKITLGDLQNTQAFCNPSFYDSPKLNVATENLLGTTQCKNSSSTTSDAATFIAATGTTSPRISLPTYLSTTNLLDVNYANSAQVIANNGSTSTTLNGAGQLTVTSNSGGTTASQTLTLKVQSSVLSLPAGEYAKVASQAGGVLHFQGGSVATRIKQLSVANCNGSTMEFEPGDYYIETASWQQSCHLAVSPAASGNTATSVNLYFKNAFTLNAGPTCWNISGTCGSTMGSTQIQAQQPQKLKLYVYNGNFTTVQGAQIAAGIYVDQGDVSLTSANNFAIIGEVFAKNIRTTNGGVTAFAYRQVLSTTTTGGGSNPGPGAAPNISLTAPLNNTNFSAPANIVLTAVAVPQTLDGNNGPIGQVQFYQGTTLIGTANAPIAPDSTSYSITWNNVAVNSYSITAKAIDTKNNIGTSTPVNISVVNNNAPAVGLTASPVNAVAPATIILNANATDSDGTIAKVEFFNGTNLIATVTTAPYSFNWTEVPGGNYSLTAKATDNLGVSTTSAPVTVSVTAHVAKFYDIHSDHLGTPRVITDDTGSEVWRWDSTPFGETLANEQPASSTKKFTYNIRFPGQYFDAETNLHYNYFRDYDPQTGRYIQSDPIGLAGGLNTYGYVEGNPVRYFDALGLDKQIGVSASGTIFAGFIGGGGGATFGITTDGTISGTSLFLTEQVNAMVGVGAYAGVGAAPYAGRTDGPMTSSSGSVSGYAEADLGTGPAAFSGAVAADKDGNWGANGSGPVKAIPGVGLGAAVGVGVSYSSTQVSPSFGEIWKRIRDLGKNKSKQCK
ncbi:hypothetical protein H8L32_18610 [Undibacterium sp. CY18W]|uniref:Teneurin-like YD-shell domain-containing protein n=1 Tax=Undibacterium hunanense TaxID=2762292 RepID=A0ABR6ZUG3_9BURK|nr:RHS repeat-associated core domain-containing protein [Undibacterium hunanense]MBC3919506.1 hypothetical protein [Undibacterium hunanense]